MLFGWLGNLYLEVEGDLDKARDYFGTSAETHREVGDRNGECNALGSLGRVCNLLDEHEQAVGYLEPSLEAAREAGNKQWIGTRLTNLGIAYSGLSRSEDAVGCFMDAIEVDRQLHDPQGEKLDTELLNRELRKMNRGNSDGHTDGKRGPKE